MKRIYNENIIKIPKYNVNQIINKFLISIGIKLKNRVRVYYLWENKEPKSKKFKPFVAVDFDKDKREWYLNYVETPFKIHNGTIDDITGQISISII